jgi:hypothetical protein
VSDTLLDTLRREKEELLDRINVQKQKGDIDPDRAEDLENKIEDAATKAIQNIKETNNVSVESIDDTSDTEGYLYNLLPVIFFMEVPFIRILSIIYTLYNVNLFSVCIYYGTLLMNKIGK